MRVKMVPIVISTLGTKKLGRKTGGIGNQRKNQDYLIYGIVEIGQITQKIPGYLRRLAVIQTPMKGYQLKLG